MLQAFSVDGKKQTIRAKDQGKEKSIGRVYRKELTFRDIKVVNTMYKCDGTYSVHMHVLKPC